MASGEAGGRAPGSAEQQQGLSEPAAMVPTQGRAAAGSRQAAAAAGAQQQDRGGEARPTEPQARKGGAKTGLTVTVGRRVAQTRSPGHPASELSRLWSNPASGVRGPAREGVQPSGTCWCARVYDAAPMGTACGAGAGGRLGAARRLVGYRRARQGGSWPRQAIGQLVRQPYVCAALRFNAGRGVIAVPWLLSMQHRSAGPPPSCPGETALQVSRLFPFAPVPLRAYPCARSA